MYSQNDEEGYIVSALPPVGNFLDIGAYNGKTFSNTLKLVENGWSGVCVEPSPSIFAQLFELHKNHPNVRCVLAAITHLRESKAAMFYDCGGDAIGTLNEDHVAKWSSFAKFSPFLLWTVPLWTLMSSLNQDFDFVNIDVEGSSVELFAEFAHLYRGTALKCVCVEYDGQVQACDNIASKLGMKRIHMTGENLIYSK